MDDTEDDKPDDLPAFDVENGELHPHEGAATKEQMDEAGDRAVRGALLEQGIHSNALTPGGLSALMAKFGQNAPTQPPPTAPPAAPNRANIAPTMVMPPMNIAAAPRQSVDDMLAPQAQELKDYEAKQAISGVSDPAADAKRAADARQAQEEAELRQALDAAKQSRSQTGLQAFITNLADPSGKLRERQINEANAPLQELLQRREQLGKIRDERVKREEQARQTALNDPNSELTKTSALALRAIGAPVPKGYSASMFEQMKQLTQLSGEERDKAAHRIVEQRKVEEEGRHNRNQEAIERQRLNNELAEKLGAAKATKESQLVDTATRAHTGLQEAGTNLKKLIDKYGPGGGLTGPGRAELEQARNEVAEQALKLRQAANPGAALRPNAIEEERNLVFQPGYLQQGSSAQLAIDNYLRNKRHEAARLGVSTGGLVRHGGKLYKEDKDGNAVEVPS